MTSLLSMSTPNTKQNLMNVDEKTHVLLVFYCLHPINNIQISRSWGCWTAFAQVLLVLSHVLHVSSQVLLVFHNGVDIPVHAGPLCIKLGKICANLSQIRVIGVQIVQVWHDSTLIWLLFPHMRQQLFHVSPLFTDCMLNMVVVYSVPSVKVIPW